MNRKLFFQYPFFKCYMIQKAYRSKKEKKSVIGLSSHIPDTFSMPIYRRHGRSHRAA